MQKKTIGYTNPNTTTKHKLIIYAKNIATISGAYRCSPFPSNVSYVLVTNLDTKTTSKVVIINTNTNKN